MDSLGSPRATGNRTRSLGNRCLCGVVAIFWLVRVTPADPSSVFHSFLPVAVERCHSRLWRWSGAVPDCGGGAVPFQIVAVERCRSRLWRWSGAVPDCGGGAVPFQIVAVERCRSRLWRWSGAVPDY
ncbi:hypothetical protein H6P81_011808 [Aristolochia fimbriata]|uniref:Secreted protein n=1 Tax=Aristolochia fimbriata TaxID=158543 RepID=A0AAV7EA01_ARIFI|nr:hypothetical protein H6P81_011808 [Aristolochia fimbriata]